VGGGGDDGSRKPGATAILAAEADGPSQGWMGEQRRALAWGELAERRAERRPTLFNALGHGGTREKGGAGVVGSVPRQGRIGAEKEGPGCGTM
jgi:hypothetical protein